MASHSWEGGRALAAVHTWEQPEQDHETRLRWESPRPRVQTMRPVQTGRERLHFYAPRREGKAKHYLPTDAQEWLCAHQVGQATRPHQTATSGGTEGLSLGPLSCVHSSHTPENKPRFTGGKTEAPGSGTCPRHP